jgi:single-strand DNA-binding protein
MNSVSLIGRLTRDPELRHTQSGTSVCEFSIAVDRAGDKEDDGSYGPGFFDVTVWEKAAETCAQYLEKGQQVGVTGRLTFHRWEATDGTKRSKVGIDAGRAFGVDFLAKAGERRDDGQQEFEPVAQGSASKAPAASYEADDDIPF